jgi:hypothetical protein
MDEYILKIAQQIGIFGILNSIIGYGIIQTTEKWMGKTAQSGDTISLNVRYKLILIYIMGFCWGPFLQLTTATTGLMGWHLWSMKIAMGVFIGIFSVAIYSTAVRGILELIPAVFDAIKLIISSWGQGIANKVSSATQTPTASPNPTPEQPLIQK